MKILISHYCPLNAYCALLGEAYIKNGHEVFYGANNFHYSNVIPDILHIQWPESLYKWQVSIGLPEEINLIKKRLEWYKQHQTKIIHTIHNIEPHELENKYETDIYELVIEYADLLVHHGANSIPIINKKYPIATKKKSVIAHHGHYLRDYKAQTKEDARKALALPLNDMIILNFGMQRGYKNQKFLSEIFNRLECDNKLLLNAGKPQIVKVSRVEKLLSKFKSNIFNKSQLKIVNHYKHIPQSEVSLYFNAADLVFLGHSKGLNSGVLVMAATHSRPLVYPDIGNFTEQVEGWVGYPYENNNMESALLALEKAVQTMNENLGLNNSKWLENNSWEQHVKVILDNLC